MLEKNTRTHVVCQKCGVEVKSQNYSKHMSNVHGENTKMKSSSKTKVIIMAITLIAIIGIALSYNSISKGGSVNPEQTQTDTRQLEENIIKIPISEISTVAKWYTYDSNGEKVRYLLVKGTDGKIHLGTDACDVCFKNKKGYSQNGNVLTCNNCQKTYAINSLGTDNLSGGCWPSYLPMRIDGSYVVIERSDLDAKQFMFK